MDAPDVQWSYSGVDDAYTCLYNYRLETNPIHPLSKEATQYDTEFAAYGIISTVPYEFVFGSPVHEAGDKNRANMDRYLAANIAHFLAARSFWSTLARDHIVKNCLMETNWGGGDYKGPYLTAGLCDECINIVGSKDRQQQLSYRLATWNATDVKSAIHSLCLLPNRWDRYVSLVNILRSGVFPFLFGAVAVGLLTNLIAGFDTNKSLLDYLLSHPLALAITVVALFSVCICWAGIYLLRRKVP